MMLHMKLCFGGPKSPVLRVLMLLFALLSSQPTHAQDSFTRITSGPVLSGVNSTIVAWGDFNNDTFQDLFVSTRTGPSLLYSNNGNGTFSQILAAPVGTDTGNSFGATWGDYDNDGWLDLFVGISNSGNDWLYRNNGGSGFTKITTGAIVTSGGNANNCGWADYDNDSFLDLWVANSDQNDFVYRNNGNGTFTRITTNAIAVKTGNSQGGSWGDYDNDGWPDLFVSRVNEPNLLYHNEGNGDFRPVTNSIVVQEASAGQGTSWGDYDNDGYLDLFVVNPTSRNFLYHNHGDGTFRKITNGAIATDVANGHGCGWADYDNDGWLDMFVANRLGANFLYRNNGDGTFARLTTGVVSTDVADAFSGAWADYNNDGFQDLFVAELNSNNNRLYRNNGNTNAWLTLKLEGRLSNRSAIGAKVRVRATIDGSPVWQLREISAGGGLGCQNDLRAAFGLGNATNAEVVRIEWPSRIVQELHNVPARQFLAVVEPEAHITPATQEVQAGQPAVFSVESTLEPPVEFQWKFNGVALPGETNSTLTIAAMQASQAGAYSAALNQPASGLSFDTRPAQLTGPITLIQQPADVGVRLGSNGVLRVTAAGIAPIAYQWHFNGADLPNATNNTLTLTNAQIVDEGEYAVTVSNSFGAVNSTLRLTVLVSPTIVWQPASQSVPAGGTAVFSVSATGHPLPLTFRWRRNGVYIQNVVLYQSNCFFTVTNAQPGATTNQFYYTVVVTNRAGNSSLSRTAVLTVMADEDRDGLPDDWEAEHGLISTNAADASLDADDDGMTNLAEYIARTNPNDAASRLRMELRASNTDTLTVRFLAASNQTYRLEHRDAVDFGTWTEWSAFTASPTNRWWESDARRLTNGREFFRLVAPNQ
jgi:enediyne biosynthesis protein E4